MALIGINLINNGTTTIDSSNVGNPGDTIQLNLVASGTVIVDGVNANISNIVGIGAVSNTTIEAVRSKSHV